MAVITGVIAQRLAGLIGFECRLQQRLLTVFVSTAGNHRGLKASSPPRRAAGRVLRIAQIIEREKGTQT